MPARIIVCYVNSECARLSTAGDVTDCLMRCGARLNFNLASTTGTIAQQFWDISQPPMQVCIHFLTVRT